MGSVGYVMAGAHSNLQQAGQLAVAVRDALSTVVERIDHFAKDKEG